MKRLFGLAAAVAATCGLSNGIVANDYWYSAAQREQIHQQYLSPIEHNALHQGLNNSYGMGAGSYSPAFNGVYGSSYNAGYGVTSPIYSNGYGVPSYNYSRTRSNCATSNYNRGPIFGGYRAW